MIKYWAKKVGISQRVAFFSLSTEEPQWELSRYEPALAQILAAYCNNKLPEETFPFVAGSAPPATSSQSISARSVRTSTTWASNKQQDSSRSSRSDRPKVVFIVGGYSYMEVKYLTTAWLVWFCELYFGVIGSAPQIDCG